MAEGIGGIISKLGINYSYIGFGSLWFTDFIHFHKFLNIQQMFSIERDKIIYDRAFYNKPYSCIQLFHGESTEKIEKILSECKIPSISWLDYDNSIFSCNSFVPDVGTIVTMSQNASILIVTMNVNNKIVKDLRDNPATPDWKDRVKKMIKGTFGNVNIDGHPNNYFTNQEKFIEFVNPLFFQTIQNSIYNSGNKKVCYKIFDFSYADNAEMVTQGFIIFDEDKDKEIEKLNEMKSNYFLNESCFRIEAPVLTVREKNSIDKNMPSQNITQFITDNGYFEHETEDYLRPERFGFPINLNTLKSYSELYKFYPTYFEIMGS